jgi:hypothetical protein
MLACTFKSLVNQYLYTFLQNARSLGCFTSYAICPMYILSFSIFLVLSYFCFYVLSVCLDLAISLLALFPYVLDLLAGIVFSLPKANPYRGICWQWLCFCQSENISFYPYSWDIIVLRMQSWKIFLLRCCFQGQTSI